MGIADIENAIISVLGQNAHLLRNGKINGQINGSVNGKNYVLGLSNGRVSQFYPE